MKIWKRFTPQLCLLGVICLIAAFGYVKGEIIPTNADIDSTKTIIIDAGHAALENTIKTPKIIAKQMLKTDEFSAHPFCTFLYYLLVTFRYQN